jgi:hypothetical protein
MDIEVKRYTEFLVKLKPDHLRLFKDMLDDCSIDTAEMKHFQAEALRICAKGLNEGGVQGHTRPVTAARNGYERE